MQASNALMGSRERKRTREEVSEWLEEVSEDAGGDPDAAFPRALQRTRCSFAHALLLGGQADR